MIWTDDYFKPRTVPCPLGPDRGYMVANLREAKNGLPVGSPITVKLITTFDGSTWWAFAYELEQFVIVDFTIPKPETGHV